MFYRTLVTAGLALLWCVSTPIAQPLPDISLNWIRAGHTYSIFGVAVSNDGTMLVSSSWDETVRVWSLPDRKPLYTLTGHPDRVSSVAISPDGATIVSGDYDGYIKVWNSADGTLRYTIAAHTGNVNSVAISPDGSTIASGSFDDTAKLWDISDGSPIRTLSGHTMDVRSVAFTPDGTKLVSGSVDSTLRVWDTATGALINTITGHRAAVMGVAVGLDGDTIVSAGYDSTVGISSITADTLSRQLSGHLSRVFGVAISPDGNTIASVGQDYTVRRWDVATGSQIGSPSEHPSYTYCATFTPDGETIVVGGDANMIGFWRTSDGASLGSLSGPNAGVTKLAAGVNQTLLSGNSDAKVEKWSLTDGAAAGVQFGQGDSVTCLVVSPDMTEYVIGFDDTSLLLRRYSDLGQTQAFYGHDGTPRCAAFTPSSDTIVSGDDDATIRMWKRGTLTPIWSGYDHGGPVNGIAVTSDGQKMVSGSADESIIVWDLSSGVSVERTITGHAAAVTCLALSPDDSLIASGDVNGLIKVWTLADGQIVRTITAHDSTVTAVRFTPDGSALLSSSDDGTAKVWRVDDGAPMQTLAGPTAAVKDVVISPDGRTIVAGAISAELWAWTVDPPFNDPPVWAGREDLTVPEDSLFSFDVLATDPEGQALTYSATAIPAGAAFDPDTRLFDWQPSFEQAGDYLAIFSVTDGVWDVLDTVAITVTDVNRPPLWETVADTTVDPVEALSLQIIVSDPDGNSVTCTMDDAPDGASFDTESLLFTWTPTYEQIGEHIAAFSTTDGTETSLDTVTIIVNDVNREPVWAARADTGAIALQLLTFTVQAFDPDGDDLTYSLVAAPTGATFDPGTQAFAWTPDAESPENAEIVFDVTDGEATVRDTVAVTVDLSVGMSSSALPVVFALNQNAPNPFNPSTEIVFSLTASQHVRLTVWNQHGQLIRTLVDRTCAAGTHRVVWDGRDDLGHVAASGPHFCRLRADEGTLSRRMILVR